MSMKRIVWLMATLLSTVAVVTAQSEFCSMIPTMLETAENACSDLDRNQVCYGNEQITALDLELNPVDGFDTVGSIIDVRVLNSLVSSPFNATTNRWGISLMALQANLPAEQTEQNVTFAIIGDAELTDQLIASLETVESLPGASTGGINLRSAPSTESDTVGGLIEREEVTVVGRTADAEWLQIEYEGSTAWVFAILLTVEGDIASLPIIADPAFGDYSSPMQAFTLRTGIGTSNCEQAPSDGLLIQAPRDTTVNMLINNVELEMSSTVFIRSEGSFIRIFNLEGRTTIISAGVIQNIPVGFSSIARDGNLPSISQPYDFSELQNLPVNLLLNEISIPFAVVSNNQWFNTNLTLNAGDSISLVAGGVINFWEFCEVEKVGIGLGDTDCNSLILGPEGGDPLDLEGNPMPSDMNLFPEPFVPPYSLVGRIGSSVFPIGNGGTFTAEESGVLELRTNDTDINNIGAFIVTTLPSAP